jgi:hypothetical protein
MLKIVNIKSKKFKMLDGKGYYITKGYAFLETENNKYIGFICDNGCPYNPKSGKKILQEILDAGGFIGFDRMLYIDEMEVNT